MKDSTHVWIKFRWQVIAVVEKSQVPLIKLLEKNGINCIPLQWRHGRTLGGGFHCVTLDVRRRGTFEDYT